MTQTYKFKVIWSKRFGGWAIVDPKTVKRTVNLKEGKMQREIKFRGKRLDTGEWVYGSLVKELDGWSICDWGSVAYPRYDVDPETVGQFTGLKDKVGLEIYGGDIVQKTNSLTGQKMVKSLVRYNPNSARFTGLSFGTSVDMEIIGYDNPELLK